MKKILYLLLLIIITPLTAQTVTSFTDGTPDDAIVLDSNGTIYASNFTGDTVFMFNSNGDAQPFITGLNTPNGLAFDSNDNLYVCDFNAQTIFKYDSSGNQLDSFSISGNPSGLIKAFDNDDVIFTNYSANTINRLESNGTITEVSSATELNGPVGLAYDEAGVLYTGNYNDREIYKIESNGDATYIAQLPTDGGPLPNLGFIAYGQGKLWGTTMGSDKIFVVNPNAVDDYTLFAGSIQGGMDGDISVATFHTPNGILFNDAQDTMYITDFGSKNLRIISGIVLDVNDFASQTAQLKLYPNPATDILNIEATVSDSGTYSMDVMDALGRIIIHYENESLGIQISEQLNVETWSRGIYFVNVSSGNQTVTKKFIK